MYICEMVNNDAINIQSVIVCIVCCRYTVKELLQLEFFAEETGIRVDIVKTSVSAMDEVPADVIQLQLRVVDPKKRRLQQRENEAVQFDYNISTDNPNAVAHEMVCMTQFSFSLLLLLVPNIV